MNRWKQWGVLLAMGGLLSVPSQGTEDPRLGKVSYQGTGEAEMAPEYGEAWFSFTVDCRKSARDVRAAIEAESDRIWRAIVKEVGKGTYTETNRVYWDNIAQIREKDGSVLQVTRPQNRGGNVLPGQVKRIDVCTGKEIALKSSLPSIYSGSQRFGVRSSNLDWLEGLVRTVKDLPSTSSRSAVQVSASGIEYGVTEASRRELLEEVLEKARAQATGKGSEFASDVQNLKFANAHFLGHNVTRPQPYFPQVGQPVSRGEAPKVTLSLPFTYVMYAEGEDVVDSTSSKTIGLTTEYEVKGEAVVEADFATSTVAVSTGCHTSRKAALDALEATADTVLNRLRQYNNGADSETDGLVNNEPSAYTEYPYQQVEWDETQARTPVKTYLNTCTLDLVPAPDSDNTSHLTPYWSASRTFILKSSDFDRVLQLTDELQAKYAVSSSRTDDVRVAVTEPTGDVTGATRRKLALAARENATQCVLDPNGLLASDIEAHGLSCAHLKEIRVGNPQVPQERAMLKSAAAADMESAPAGAAAELAIEVVKKPNEERPKFRMVRHYEFKYQFVTENYVPELEAEEEEEEQAEEAPVTPLAARG